MFKIIKKLKTALLVCVILVTPTFASAGESGFYNEYDYSPSDYQGGTYAEGDYAYSYDTPYSYDTYDYTPYSYDSYDYGYDNSDYGNYGYDDSGYYGGDYGSNYGGYYPSYSTPSSTYGGNIYGGYNYPTYTQPVVTTPVVSTSNAVANAVANNNNVNNNVNNNTNVNNVYVYTNPSGTAVINNPAHQRLDGYCVVSPSNARTGQTVTATAYASGGIGSYTYQWSGDVSGGGYGASTSFTSYNPGTKNITVTIRSGEEVTTKSCSVTFAREYIEENFSAVCYPSTQNATVGQTITWRVTVNGQTYNSSDYYGYGTSYGNNYSYTWNGSDGLYGSGSTVSKTYTYPGSKSATVTVSNGNRTISATCSANVNQVYSYSPTSGTPVSGVYVQPDQIKTGTPISGVYLNDLPATGIDMTWKHYMIAFMVIILATVGFLMSRSRKSLYATQE